MRKLIAIYLFVASFPAILSATMPKPTGVGVTDTVNILTPEQKAQIDQLLLEYKKKSTNEIAVVIVQSLEGQDIKQYANILFHNAGIGLKGKNNGLLFLWSVGDQKIRFEVGYGLEPVLPDGRAGQIIREVITPAFRDKRWFDGVRNGINAAITQIEAKTPPLVEKTINPKQSISSTEIYIYCIIGIGIAFVFAGLIIFFIRTERKKEEETRSLLREEKYGEIPYSPLLRSTTIYPNPSSSSRSYSRASTKSKEEHTSPSVCVAPTYEPSSNSSSWSNSSSDSGSSWSSGGDSGGGGGFGGGDSGGGGADGSY